MLYVRVMCVTHTQKAVCRVLVNFECFSYHSFHLCFLSHICKNFVNFYTTIPSGGIETNFDQIRIFPFFSSVTQKKTLNKNLQMWYKMPKPHSINQFYILLLLLLIYLILPLIEVKLYNMDSRTNQRQVNNNRFKVKSVLYFCCNFSSQFCFIFCWFLFHVTYFVQA